MNVEDSQMPVGEDDDVPTEGSGIESKGSAEQLVGPIDPEGNPSAGPANIQMLGDVTPPAGSRKTTTGRPGLRVHKQTEKMAKRLSTIRTQRDSIHKVLVACRREEKTERQRMKRLWAKASKLDIATMTEIAEMKGYSMAADTPRQTAASSSSSGNPVGVAAAGMPRAPPLPE